MKRAATSPLSQQLLAEMQDPLFQEMLKLLVDDKGRAISPFANLSPAQIAKLENISVDTLNAQHQSSDPDAAPARHAISSRRWGYIAFLYVAYKVRKIRKAEGATLLPWRKRTAEREASVNNEVAT
jgi:hypothetical protein